MKLDHHDPLEIPEYDRGLQYDLSTLINRRQALRVLAGSSLLAIISCGGGGAVTTTLPLARNAPQVRRPPARPPVS